MTSLPITDVTGEIKGRGFTESLKLQLKKQCSMEDAVAEELCLLAEQFRSRKQLRENTVSIAP